MRPGRRARGVAFSVVGGVEERGDLVRVRSPILQQVAALRARPRSRPALLRGGDRGADVAEPRRCGRRLERAVAHASRRPARGRRGTARPRGRAPRRRRSRGAAGRRTRRRAGRGRTRARARARRARRARPRRRVARRTPAACPPAGRGRRRAAGPSPIASRPVEPPDRRAGLAARELGDVGVQLLRHHRRAGRGVLGQAREAELASTSRARAPRRSARGA